jgi:lipooligosaccharide transport system permease protein
VTRVLDASTIYFLRLRKAGHSTILVAILNPLFVLAAMGLGLGSLVKNEGALGHVSYLSFIAPALMAAFSMQAAAGQSLWPVLGGIRWEGTYIAQVATPLRPYDVLLGQLTYTCSDITMRATCTLLAMVVLGAAHSPWAVLTLPVAVLTGMAYATPITGFSATQQTDSAFPLIMRLGVIPSYLFSGTFFPISQLPVALRGIAMVLPLWHGVDLCRSLALGRATLLGFVGHVAYLSLFVGVSLVFARRAFERRLHA